MKKLFLFLMLVVPFVVFAQQNRYKDIVELKNGSVIKGTIIEQIPNQQIKIQTADGNILVYQMDEVKMLRQKITPKKEVNQNGKGYGGTSLGLSTPIASDVPKGLVISVIDFGYCFTSNIGIAARFSGRSHKKNRTMLSIGSLMVGGLVLFPISRNVEFINRALIGLEKGQMLYSGIGREKEKFDVGMVYDLGVGLKFNVGKKVALLTHLDYTNMKYFNSINMTIGIAYRLL